jgi:hypothetical protein
MDEITTTDNEAWMKLFDQLNKDRMRFLRQELTLKGKKAIIKSAECVFFLGKLKIQLTEKGIKFGESNGV